MAGVANPKLSYGETTTIKRSVVDQIEIVSPKATPVLKRLSPGMNNLSVVCDEVKYEWVEDELSITSSLLATATINTTTTTAEITEHEGEYILKGMIVLIDSEQMLIGTKGTADDIITFATTVGRGWGSTTATTHAVGAVVEIIGRTHIEGADAPDDSYTVPTMPYNYIQTFQAEVQLSDIEAAIKRWGVRDQWAYQEGKKLSETMKWVERQMFYGKAVALATSTPGSFGGFEEYTLAANKNNLSDAELLRSHLEDLLQEIFVLVGEEFMPNLLICNGWVKRKISKFYEPYVRTVRDESTGGQTISRVETDLGALDILLSKTCPAAKAYVLNTNMIGLGPLKGEGFHILDLARTGTAEQRMLVGTYTMEMRNPKCHGMIYGISTSL